MPAPASSARPSVTSVTGARRRGGGGGVAGPGSGRSHANGAAPSGSQDGGCCSSLPCSRPSPATRLRTVALAARTAGPPAGPRSARLRCSRNSSAAAASSGRMNPPRPPKIDPTDTMVAITSPTTRIPRLRRSGHRRVGGRVGQHEPPDDVQRGPDPEERGHHEPDAHEHRVDVIPARDPRRDACDLPVVPGACGPGLPHLPERAAHVCRVHGSQLSTLAVGSIRDVPENPPSFPRCHPGPPVSRWTT